MKPLVIIAIVAVLLVGGLFLFSGGDSNTPTERVLTPSVQGSPGNAVHQIRITAGGMVPREFTVTAGDRVTFLNETEARAWPASDVHPIHSICPGFDAVGGIPPGGRYTHTFTESGACPYHDHLRSSDGAFQGTITVK